MKLATNKPQDDLDYSTDSSASDISGKVQNNSIGNTGGLEKRFPTLSVPVAKTEFYNSTRKNLKIAIVDDNRDLLLTLEKIVRKLGYREISTFDNGTLLVGAIMKEKLSFDVLIMDYQMPEMNGIEAAKIIKRYRKDTRIILVSAYDFVEDKAMEGGFEFLKKPFGREKLAKIFRQGNNVLEVEPSQIQE